MTDIEVGFADNDDDGRLIERQLLSRVATFARRLKRDWRRGCRCDAKKISCGNRKRFARHCARSYHFVIAL